MQTKKCSRCKKEKALDQFHNSKNRKYGKHHTCIDCCKKFRKKYPPTEKGKKYTEEYSKKPEVKFRNKLNHKNRQEKNKFLVMQAYGNKCVCCGEYRIEFLTIEHSFKDGKQHRARIMNIYRDLIKRNFPQNEGYLCMCYNCNIARGHKGYCPHQVERGELISLQIITRKGKK